MAAEVLVVEDEPDIRNLIVLHLSREGFRCRTAKSGPEALREARAATPDLVILDLMLPDLDGLEVCRRLRSDAATATIPIIMLTAKADEVDRVVGLEMGADDYVVKPFSPKELIARIRAVPRPAHPDAQGCGLPVRGRLMLPALLHAIRRSVALKLTLTLIGFVGISLIAAGIYLNQALETFAVEALEARLATAARLLMEDARGLVARRAGPNAVRAFAVRASEPSGSRITLIALDGRVLGDSDVLTAALPQVENHAGRPEVRAALAGHVGRHLRRSVTIDQPLLYVALPVRDGDQITAVLRLALPLSAVTASYRAIHRVMLIGGLVALLVALGIGMFVAGRVTDPVVQMQTIAREMSEGNFAARAPVRSPDEIGVLARAINTLAQRLRDRLADLQHERAKIGAILDGMVEGVLAVDGRGHVVLMNERARTMFGPQTARPEGTPLLEVVR